MLSQFSLRKLSSAYFGRFSLVRNYLTDGICIWSYGTVFALTLLLKQNLPLSLLNDQIFVI